MGTQPLPNPFNAGAGVAPPVFAGRSAEEAALSAAVKQLGERDGNGKANIAADVVVYGPRGHGKTVLLQRLRERAAAHPGWGVLDVDVGAHGGSPAALDDELHGRYTTANGFDPSNMWRTCLAIGVHLGPVRASRRHCWAGGAASKRSCSTWQGPVGPKPSAWNQSPGFADRAERQRQDLPAAMV